MIKQAVFHHPAIFVLVVREVRADGSSRDDAVWKYAAVRSHEVPQQVRRQSGESLSEQFDGFVVLGIADARRFVKAFQHVQSQVAIVFLFEQEVEFSGMGVGEDVKHLRPFFAQLQAYHVGQHHQFGFAVKVFERVVVFKGVAEFVDVLLKSVVILIPGQNAFLFVPSGLSRDASVVDVSPLHLQADARAAVVPIVEVHADLSAEPRGGNPPEVVRAVSLHELPAQGGGVNACGVVGLRAGPQQLFRAAGGVERPGAQRQRGRGGIAQHGRGRGLHERVLEGAFRLGGVNGKSRFHAFGQHEPLQALAAFFPPCVPGFKHFTDRYRVRPHRLPGLLGPSAELLLHPLPGLDVVGITVDFVQRVEQLLCHGWAAPSAKEAGQHEGENSAFHRRVGFSQAFEYIVKSERKAFCPLVVHISLMIYAIKVAKSCRFSMFAGLFFSSRPLVSGLR